MSVQTRLSLSIGARWSHQVIKCDSWTKKTSELLILAVADIFKDPNSTRPCCQDDIYANPAHQFPCIAAESLGRPL